MSDQIDPASIVLRTAVAVNATICPTSIVLSPTTRSSGLEVGEVGRTEARHETSAAARDRASENAARPRNEPKRSRRITLLSSSIPSGKMDQQEVRTLNEGGPSSGPS